MALEACSSAQRTLSTGRTKARMTSSPLSLVALTWTPKRAFSSSTTPCTSARPTPSSSSRASWAISTSSPSATLTTSSTSSTSSTLTPSPSPPPSPSSVSASSLSPLRLATTCSTSSRAPATTMVMTKTARTAPRRRPRSSRMMVKRKRKRTSRLQSSHHVPSNISSSLINSSPTVPSSTCSQRTLPPRDHPNSSSPPAQTLPLLSRSSATAFVSRRSPQPTCLAVPQPYGPSRRPSARSLTTTSWSLSKMRLSSSASATPSLRSMRQSVASPRPLPLSTSAKSVRTVCCRSSQRPCVSSVQETAPSSGRLPRDAPSPTLPSTSVRC
mmetsp:Transcript_50491/g.83781  ORF Transcript_50491/g.83781 Transcript_50491/m.83781 type:complete len:327 (+) Transcript_50491:206-1186(+)